MLDLACFKGCADCVESLLLQGGKVITHDDATRRTPLHAAALNGHTKCLHFLLETAEDGNVVDCTDARDRYVLQLRTFSP